MTKRSGAETALLHAENVPRIRGSADLAADDGAPARALPKTALRAAPSTSIGKAVSHEIEAPDALVGGDPRRAGR